jgi:Rieske Fe-S protein
MPRMVWAGIGADGLAERIYKNRKLAVIAGEPMGGAYMLRAQAVTEIRRKIWLRDNKTCTHCGQTVPWNVMQMHERIWRGRGGEISVANGTALCYHCHQCDDVAGHGKRSPQWTA